MCRICRQFLTTMGYVVRCTNPEHWRDAGLTPPEGFCPEALGSPNRVRVSASRPGHMRLFAVDHCADYQSAKASALARFHGPG
jgi:hypothetical protein